MLLKVSRRHPNKLPDVRAIDRVERVIILVDVGSDHLMCQRAACETGFGREARTEMPYRRGLDRANGTRGQRAESFAEESLSSTPTQDSENRAGGPKSALGDERVTFRRTSGPQRCL